jgi:hypothetical protein
MTSVFDDTGRADPRGPVTLTPRAAEDGGPVEPDDGAGFDFSVFLSMDASLGRLADGLAAERMRRDSQEPPSNPRLYAAGTVPASGTMILDLGSVPRGFVWQVRRVGAGGIAATTVAAGKAYVFAQGTAPRDLVLGDCEWIFAALPDIKTWSTHQLFLLGGDHLFVAFVGATPAQQYTASARVEQWDDATYRSTFVE